MNTNEVLKLALEALIGARAFLESDAPVEIWGVNDKAITALREALAEQPAQQEPVAAQSVMTVRIWRDKNSDQNAEFKNWHKLPDGEHILYTSPPAQRTWVGLSDVEWMNIVNKDQAWFGQRPDEVAHEVAKLVEAKLKEKNT